MATHASVLAWRIPRTEEPGELQPVGSQSLLSTHTCTLSHRRADLGQAGARVPLHRVPAQTPYLYTLVL